MMLDKLMNGKSRVVLTSFLGLLWTQCGDGIRCPDNVELSIQPVSSQLDASNDIDSGRPGIQIDVVVTTNIGPLKPVQLEIDSNGNVSTINAQTDSNGLARFQSVDMPNGAVTLQATASSGCGDGVGSSNAISVTVSGNAGCELLIAEGPIDVPFYAPILVLNQENDSDAATADFQANVVVNTDTSANVKIFTLDIGSGDETELVEGAATGGTVSFPLTLAQGQHALRATCETGPVSGVSPTTTVFVDTNPPTCALTKPEENITVIPSMDEDEDTENGIQFIWTGSADSGVDNDILGEPAEFAKDGFVFDGTTIDENGLSSSVDVGTFADPGDAIVSFTTQDHAQNKCVDEFTVPVILEGCSIALVSPTAAVNTDSDGNAANGLQSDVVAQVDLACVGLEATADCGEGPVTATVGTDGVTTFSDVTLDADIVIEGSKQCTVSVTNNANFTTSDSTTVVYDTSIPVAQLQFIDPPALMCGDSLPGDGSFGDLDSDPSNGIQIEVNVAAPLSIRRDIELTNTGSCGSTCTTTLQMNSNIIITLEPGNNDIRAVAADAAGNVGRSEPCNIAVTDLEVSFAAPVDAGLIGTPDDEIPGGAVDVTVCGTVSDPAATVTLTIDGGAPIATTVDGAGNWCTNIAASFTDGTYSLVVNATSGNSVGTNAQALAVDTVLPPAPTGLSGFAPDRTTLQVTWTSPDDNGAPVDGYIVKYLEFNDFTDFNNEGTLVSIIFPPSLPGLSETVDISGVNAGVPYYVGIVAIDAAGNQSAPTTFGPIIPEFDRTGVAQSPLANNGEAKFYGYRVSGGDFNADGFSDVAVSAPTQSVNNNRAVGEVYVYNGSATGVDFSAPFLTIQGTSVDGQFGNGMTRLDWDGIGGDDLVVSAPYANAATGRVYIFSSTTLAAGGTIDVSNADATISVDSVTNDLTTSLFGFDLSAGEVNATGSREDLIIGAPNAAGGFGAAIIVYGGSTNSMVLSTTQANTVMNGAGAHYFQNPELGVNVTFFGQTVEFIGDTLAGGGAGDVAISPNNNFFDQSTTGVADYMVVLRGRTTVPTNTMSNITFSSDDLRINAPSNLNNTLFGESMAGINNTDGLNDIVVSASNLGDGSVWIVEGSQSGTVTLGATTGYMTKITGGVIAGQVDGFGRGIANPAITDEGDVNADGLADLVVSGGYSNVTVDDIRMHIWYGGQIPSGLITSDTADYMIEADPIFKVEVNPFLPPPSHIAWVGDTNADGLNDLCWSDHSVNGPVVPPETTEYNNEGAIEVFWDEIL